MSARTAPRAAGTWAALRPTAVLVVVGLVLAGLSQAGRPGLLAGVLLAQVLLTPALMHVLRAPARLGTLVIALAGCVAADVVALTGHGRVGGLAAVVALGLVASVLHQLLRRDGRPRATASLTATLLCVVVGVSAACLLATRVDTRGDRITLAALLALPLALVVALAADRLLPLGPRLPGGAGLPGLVVAAVACAAVARALVTGWQAACLGAAVAVLSLVVDAAALGADRGPARVHDPAPLRAARWQVAALLPYALLGPVALVGARLVLP